MQILYPLFYPSQLASHDVVSMICKALHTGCFEDGGRQALTNGECQPDARGFSAGGCRGDDNWIAPGRADEAGGRSRDPALWEEFDYNDDPVNDESTWYDYDYD